MLCCSPQQLDHISVRVARTAGMDLAMKRKIQSRLKGVMPAHTFLPELEHTIVFAAPLNSL